MSIFNLRIRKLFYDLLPAFAGRPLIMVLFDAVAAGVSGLYQKFLKNRAASLYRLNHTSQVQSMEHLLNDRFDNDLRRIYIADGAYRNQTFLYQPEEQRDTPIYLEEENQNTPLYQDSENGFIDESFIIHVPIELAMQEQEIRVVVNAYKLAGRKFNIEFI
jgi:hypothetical protein